jgi:hypothetical protein
VIEIMPVSVSGTATPALLFSGVYRQVQIVNTSGTNPTLYVGNGTALTTANGVPVTTLPFTLPGFITGSLYGITSSGTASVFVVVTAPLCRKTPTSSRSATATERSPSGLKTALSLRPYELTPSARSTSSGI